MSKALIELKEIFTLFGGVKRRFGKHSAAIRAVDGVNLSIYNNEILGLVGESGCGKSTLAKTLLGIQRETSGTILLDERIVSGLEPQVARRVRHDIQYVHQDPGAALDPWWRIGDSLDESLLINGIKRRAERVERINRMLEAVGLNETFRSRYPHELSGGQQRRIGLARILGLHPRIVILDEPTSGLDLSVQATVLRLIRDLRTQFGLTYLFISHDLSVVERMCDRVAIMYLGRIVEIGTAADVFSRPSHPYTQALLAAAPRLERGQIELIEPLQGDPPSPVHKPSGCAFRTRCPYALDKCGAVEPQLESIAGRHYTACIRFKELEATRVIKPRSNARSHQASEMRPED